MFEKLYISLILLILSSCTTQVGNRDSGGASSAHVRGSGSLMWPLEGEISSYYGNRNGRFHHGLDIRAEKDTNIYTVSSGVVEFAGSMRGYGNTVIVKHADYKTLYAHCYRLKVKKGQKVRKGQTIATVGTSGRSSGYHLHFEYRTLADISKDPLIFLN